MATDKDDVARDNGTAETSTTTIDKPERSERPERQEREARDPSAHVDPKEAKSVRDNIRDAIKQHGGPKVGRPRKEATAPETSETKEPAADVAEKPSGGKEIPARDEAPRSSDQAPQAPIAAAPASLSKEVRSQWDKLDPLVRNEFLRREADSAKGVEQLKSRYQPYEDALAPVRDELKATGKTEAEGIRMLVDWRRGLSGPNKAHFFRLLAQAEGIDLSQLAPRPPGTAPQQQQTQQNDPRAILQPYLAPLEQRLNGLQTEFQRRDMERVNSDISTFASGKPHFDKVRQAMGVLMANGIATGSTPKEAFDAAYERACRMDPEVFAAVQAEETAKRDAEATVARETAAKKAAEAEEVRKRKEAEEVARARKAGVGPRGSSPTGTVANKANGTPSVRESLHSAVREVRAAV